MEIKNNLLVGVPFKKSPNQSGNITPKYIIIHFTASSTAEGAISWMLNPSSKVSAHLHLDKKGDFVQLVAFNNRAYHAGKSEYKGVSDLNYHSIGIEIQNRGKVNGVYEDYTLEQIESVVAVCKALVKAYPTIIGVTGHENIAIPRGRKDDPGPKFPMSMVVQEVFGSNDQDGKLDGKRTTADLNLRQGAGTNFNVLEVLKSGSDVLVLSEKDNWSEIVVCSSKRKGFVSSKYLK